MSGTPAQNSMLEYALKLISAGYRIHPCRPRPARDTDGKILKAKSPYCAGWRTVEMSEEQVRKWWAAYPDAVPGIQCNTFWVLYVDVPSPDHNRQEDGLSALRKLEAQFGKLPKTFLVRTPSGGLHYYFYPEKGSKIGISTGRLPTGIDVRGEGGYVIAPGSVMQNGKYEVIQNELITEAPEWLLDLVLNRAPVQAMPDMPSVLEADDFPFQKDTPPIFQGGVALSQNVPRSETPIDYADPVAREVRRTVAAKALRHINLHPEIILQKDKSGRGFVCPFCGSGTGKNGTGMTENKNKQSGEAYEIPHFTCWNCNRAYNSSVFDIIGMLNGIDPSNRGNFGEIMSIAAPKYGIFIDREVKRALNISATEQGRRLAAAPAQSTAVKTALVARERQNNQREQEEPEIDYTAYFEKCAKRLNQTDYYRGISLETLCANKVGYDPAWVNPTRPTSAPTPRLIIPTSPTSYLARDTRPAEKIPAGSHHEKMTVGRKSHMFGLDWLNADRPLFITEGEIDALSFMDADGYCLAIALGGVSNASLFLQACDKTPPQKPLILAMDNDDAGRRALSVLEAGLKSKGIYYTIFELPALHDKDGRPCKDANEVLLADSIAFRKAVFNAVEEALNGEEAFKEAKREELRNQCAGRALDAFLADTRGREAVFFPTGVRELDRLLDGGLYAGLYIIGAISSLGKTTFALSIADNIAASGQDVLIFSLEMARNELIAKSVSRLTAKISLSGDNYPASTAYAQRTRSILAKDNGTHSAEEEAVIQRAFSEYRQIGEHLYISEGIGNIGVEQVRAQVQAHTRIMGRPPVVLIDYLQILAPADPHSTDKQNTDKAVLELKRISRDFATPVFAISSFNRDNYAQSVSMVAFKESGAIEYSSDVLIGMQYNGMDDPADMLQRQGLPVESGNNARVENVKLLSKYWQERGGKGEEQEIQIKVLKNRNGSRGDCIQKFWPRYNYFEDLPAQEEEYRRRDIQERRKQAAEDRERKAKEKALKQRQK